MSSCEWFEMTWTPDNLMWKLNFGTQVPNQTVDVSIHSGKVNLQLHSPIPSKCGMQDFHTLDSVLFGLPTVSG